MKSPDRLTERPLIRVPQAQLDAYTPQSLRQKSVDRIDPGQVGTMLQEAEGQRVTGIDLGGGKIIAVNFTAREGRLIPDKKEPDRVEAHGTGNEYLPFLRRVAETSEGLPIGISAAGMIEGTRLIQSPNLPAFHEALTGEYDADFANLLRQPTVDNDAQAAIKTAIADSGRNGTLPQGEGVIFAMEPGHIRLIDSLQPEGQQSPDEACGMEGAAYVCVERVVGGVAGIESRWEKTTGTHLDGRKLSERYLAGDSLAEELYDTSASLLATGIRGMGRELFEDPSKTGVILPIVGGGFGGAKFIQESPEGSDRNVTIAFHGGVNNVPGYRERVQQILATQDNHTPLRYAFTEDFSVNAGAEGAAITALAARIKTN